MIFFIFYYLYLKVIVPPLNRCFSLVGADAMQWYLELPKSSRPRLNLGGSKAAAGSSRNVIVQGRCSLFSAFLNLPANFEFDFHETQCGRVTARLSKLSKETKNYTKIIGWLKVTRVDCN